MNEEIGIGTCVKVVVIGEQYRESQTWANDIRLANYSSERLNVGDSAIVIWTGLVPNRGSIKKAVAIKHKGKDYLIGLNGVEKQKPVEPVKDDLIGKIFETVGSNKIRRIVVSKEEGLDSYKLEDPISGTNVIYRSKANLLNLARFNEVKEVTNKTVFSVGDSVVITDDGKHYPNFKPWAKKHNLENFVENTPLKCGMQGKVTHVERKYEHSTIILLGVSIKDRTIIIDSEGVDLVSKSEDSGSDSLLQQWAKAFAENNELNRRFFELWEGNECILASKIYTVVKDSEGYTSCATLYRKIKRVNDTPLASMNAQLIKHFESILLKNRLSLRTGSGKTEPLVGVVAAYREKFKKDELMKDSYVGKRILAGRMSKYGAVITDHTPEKIHLKWDDGAGTPVWDIEEFKEKMDTEWSWDVKEVKPMSDGTELLGKRIRNNDNGNIAKIMKVVSGESVTYEWEVGGNRFNKTLKEMLELLSLSNWEILGTEDQIPLGTKVKLNRETPKFLEPEQRSETFSTKQPAVIKDGLIFKTILGDHYTISVLNKEDCSICAVGNTKAGKKGVWRIKAAQDNIDKGTWTVVESYPLTLDGIGSKGNLVEYKTRPFKLKPLSKLEENRQWQHYDALTENYITQPEEQENIMQNENNVTISIPMTAYSETTTIGAYGKKVDVADEEGLLGIITRIDEDQEKLKVVNKNAKSSRIVGQINKLGAARTKITALLDALPEEGDDE